MICRHAPASSVLKEGLVRCLPLGSGCLYLKFYTSRDRQDALLLEFRALLVKLQAEETYDFFYFLRYQDPAPHLRCRFFGDPSLLLQKVLPVIAAWSLDLQPYLLAHWQVCNVYERELERYAGAAGMDLAEQLFAIDSVSYLEALSIHESYPDLVLTDLALLLLDASLSALQIDQKQRRIWYQHLAHQKKVHHEHRETQRLLADAGWRSQLPGGALLDELLTQQHRLLSKYAHQLEQVLSQKHLLPERFVAGYVHMHCNRMGLNHDQEQQAYSQLWQAYEGFAQYCPAHWQLFP